MRGSKRTVRDHWIILLSFSLLPSKWAKVQYVISDRKDGEPGDMPGISLELVVFFFLFIHFSFSFLILALAMLVL